MWSVWTCKSKKTSSSHTILSYKSILSLNFQIFHSSNYMRLTFHRDCEKLIFNWISWNTHLNRMGIVWLLSRGEILSWTQVEFFEFWSHFHCSCMDLWLFNPCSPSLTVWATMNHIGFGIQVHYLSICILKLSEIFHNL